MILSGGDFYSKSIYGQNEFSVSLTYSACRDNEVTFLGTDGDITFTVESGRVSDTNGNLVYNYTSGDPLSLEIRYLDNLYSIWCNDRLYSASQSSIVDNDYITGIYINNLSDESMTINVELYGEQPSITFSDIESTDSENYFGYVYSNGANIRLESAHPRYSIFEDLTIYPNTTISYKLVSGNLESGNIEDIVFNFDFGSIETGLPVYIEDTDEISGTYKVFVGETESETVFIEGGYKNVQYNNFSIIYSITEQKPISMSLTYIDRDGFELVTGTGIGYGLHSGFVNGSGYIICTEATGLIYPYLVTGTGITSQFVYTTGEIIYDYLIDVVGYEGPNLSTGVLFGELTGIVLDGSGHYVFDATIVGTPSISVWHGGVNLTPVGSYTGNIYSIVILNKYVQSYHYNNFTGVGMVRSSTGTLELFDVGTGDYTDTFTSDYESGQSFLQSIKDGLTIESTDTLYPDVGYIGGRISYIPDTTNITDYVRLDVSIDGQEYSYDLVFQT